MRTRLRLTLALAAAVAVALASACGGDDDGGGEPSTKDANALVRQASAALSSATSFHFRLTHESGRSAIVQGLEMERAEGDALRPNRFRADITAQFKGVTVKVKVINVGENVWMTNPFGGSDQYVDLPKGTKIAEILDPNTGVIDALNSVQEARAVREEKIGGAKATLVEGKVDAGKLKALATKAESGRSVELKLWVDDKGRPLRMRLEGPLYEKEAQQFPNIVRVMDLSKFNEPVAIDPPAGG